MKRLLILFVLILLAFNIFSQIEIVVKPEQEITGYSYSNTEILNNNYKTISEAIYFLPYCNVLHKGFPLTQAHLFFKGGSFEQTGIFIDGLKVNDPQTGHYNFDFPWTVLDIEKTEILTRGNTIFGSGALNGSVNLKLKDITQDKFTFITDYGTYNTFYSALRAEKKFENGGISLSTEKSFSDGYHKDTDYSKETIFITGQLYDNKILLGYDEKEYGAYDYYTPGKNMPSFEYVITRFGKIVLKPLQNIEISPYIRTHSDVFTLNRDNPSYYQNNHLNILYGGTLKYNHYIDSEKNISLNYNWQREEIQSSRLGYHHRIKNAALINSDLSFYDNIKSNINLALEKYDVYENFDLLPSMNFKYIINNNIETFLYYSFSARYPNFTELYYQDPYNKGDSSLKPEKAHEIGVDFNIKYDFLLFKTGIFYKYGFDIIDWGKNSPSETIWQIKNIGKIVTTGFNLGIEIKPYDFILLKANYSYLDSYISEPYISKYGLAYLRSKIDLITELNLFDVFFILKYTHKAFTDRKETKNNIDITINKKLAEWLEISFDVENLLNVYFEEVKGIPAPSRIISGKIQVAF